MLVQLQGEDEKTCVACSAINALRHFGLDANYETVVEALRLRKKPRGGSRSNIAAKLLRRDFGFLAVHSNAPHLITDPWGATVEAAYRWESFLARGYVGLLGHNTTQSNAHAVVLYGISRDHGAPLLHVYDSAQRHKNGYHVYQALDFVWWVDEAIPMHAWLEMSTDDREKFAIHPTGRDAYFVKPGPLPILRPAPVKSPFRSRKHQRPSIAGADGPLGE